MPSKPNGLVQTPTVSAPIACEIARHDGRGAGAGAATGSGRHEHHVGALQETLDAVVVGQRGGSADGRVRARAEAVGDVLADVKGDVGGALLERLEVGVDRDELDALDAGLDHAIDRVDAGAADADHAQHRPAHTARLDARLVTRPVGALRGARAGRSECPARRLRSGAPLRSGPAAGRPLPAQGTGLGGPRAAARGRCRSLAAAAGAPPASRPAARCPRRARLPEQLGERALAHARPLIASHSLGPPSRVRGRTWQPLRRDRI